MTEIKEIWGDLIEEFHKGTVDVIVHGCNCFHLMGAGIAGKIKAAYPKAYTIDVKTTERADVRKLGTYSICNIFPNKKIINMYTQFETGPRFEYSALIEGMKRLNEEFGGSELVFGFPLIGAGIGGGNWTIIKWILQTYGKDLHIIVVHYDEGDKTVGTTRTNLESKIQGLK